MSSLSVCAKFSVVLSVDTTEKGLASSSALPYQVFMHIDKIPLRTFSFLG